MSIFLFFGSRRRISGLSARKDLRKENRETENRETEKKRGLFSDAERHFCWDTIEDLWAQYDSEDVKKRKRQKEKGLLSDIVRHFVRVTIEEILAQ